MPLSFCDGDWLQNRTRQYKTVLFSNLHYLLFYIRSLPSWFWLPTHIIDVRCAPSPAGYAHRNQPQSIDLNAVRLCFQVFLPDEAGKVRHSLEPVVSEIIYDKKAMTDLQILRISRSSGSARGGTELILLCEKVSAGWVSLSGVATGSRAMRDERWAHSSGIYLVNR